MAVAEVYICESERAASNLKHCGKIKKSKGTKENPLRSGLNQILALASPDLMGPYGIIRCD